MTPTPQERSRRLVWIGAVVTGVVFAVFLEVAAVGWLHAAGLTILLALLPTVAVAQLPLARGVEIPRLQAYASSAATLAILALLSLALSNMEGGGPLGFVPLPLAALAGWTVLLVVVGLAITLVFKWISLALGLGEDPLLRALLPVSRSERLAFGGLSAAAGLGEEMAYRGYVLAMLMPLLGTAGAVALSSGVFGVLHAYQGIQGMVRTALMGAVMAGGFLLSGSLWPPVLAHFLFDVVAGIVLAEYLMVPEAGAGVAEI